MLDRERLDEPTIIKMIEQKQMDLWFLKEHRIIHGDIKPENIFLRKDGNVMLGDF